MDKRRFVGTSLDTALGKLNEWLSEGNSIGSIEVEVDDSLYESHVVVVDILVVSEVLGEFYNIGSLIELRNYLGVNVEDFSNAIGISSDLLYTSWQRTLSTQRYYANLISLNLDVPFNKALELVGKRSDGTVVEYGNVTPMEEYPYMDTQNLSELMDELDFTMEEFSEFLGYKSTDNILYLPVRGYRTRNNKSKILLDKLGIPRHHGMKLVSTPWDEDTWRIYG